MKERKKHILGADAKNGITFDGTPIPYCTGFDISYDFNWDLPRVTLRFDADVVSIPPIGRAPIGIEVDGVDIMERLDEQAHPDGYETI